MDLVGAVYFGVTASLARNRWDKGWKLLLDACADEDETARKLDRAEG